MQEREIRVTLAAVFLNVRRRLPARSCSTQDGSVSAKEVVNKQRVRPILVKRSSPAGDSVTLSSFTFTLPEILDAQL